MKKRLLLVLVLITLVLTMAGSTSALADSPPRTTGGVQFSLDYAVTPPNGDPSSRNWGHFHAVERPDGSAKGRYTWISYNAYSGWLRMDTKIDCVTFHQDADGVPIAIFVGEVTRMQPPDPYEWWDAPFWFYPGQYVKMWVRDGGSPGRNGDEIGFYLDLGAGASPSFDEHPTCAQEVLGQFLTPPLPVEAGNLVVHD